MTPKCLNWWLNSYQTKLGKIMDNNATTVMFINVARQSIKFHIHIKTTCQFLRNLEHFAKISADFFPQIYPAN